MSDHDSKKYCEGWLEKKSNKVRLLRLCEAYSPLTAAVAQCGRYWSVLRGHRVFFF